MNTLLNFFGLSPKNEESAAITTGVQSSVEYPDDGLDSDFESADYITAIKLLRQFKMVDCRDNQDISSDMQSMIKQELLSLPETCKGLAWYSSMYNANQRTGEVRIGYKCEVLDILRDGIPALKSLTLTGTRRGFIPA